MTFSSAIVQVVVGNQTQMVLVYVPDQDRRAAAIAAALTLLVTTGCDKGGEG